MTGPTDYGLLLIILIVMGAVCGAMLLWLGL